jgi:hypothetical protein
MYKAQRSAGLPQVRPVNHGRDIELDGIVTPLTVDLALGLNHNAATSFSASGRAAASGRRLDTADYQLIINFGS